MTVAFFCYVLQIGTSTLNLQKMQIYSGVAKQLLLSDFYHIMSVVNTCADGHDGAMNNVVLW